MQPRYGTSRTLHSLGKVLVELVITSVVDPGPYLDLDPDTDPGGEILPTKIERS